MNIISSARQFILFLSITAFIFLSGCGGGGSEGADKADQADQADQDKIDFIAEPVIYSGLTMPARIIDVQDSFLIAKSAVESPQFFLVAMSLWANEILPIANKRLAGPDGGAAYVEVDSDTIIITYEDFTADGLSVSGQVEQDQPQQTRMVGHIDGGMILRNVRFRTADVDVTIDGSIIGELDDVHNVSLDLIAVDNTTGQQVQLADFSMEFEYLRANDISISETITQFSGKVFDSDLGSISILTETGFSDLAFNKRTERWSGSGNGLIKITGAERSIKLVALNHHLTSIMSDTDSDGEYETALRLSWQELSEREFVEVPNQGYLPVANAGQPMVINTAGVVTMHGLYSHDMDRQPVTHHWELIFAPIGSSINRALTQGVSRTFSPDKAGVYLFALTVSDGDNSSTAAVEIEAGEYIYWPIESITNRATLEFSDMTTGIEPLLLIDARSSLLFGDDREESEFEWWLDKPSNHRDDARLLFTEGSFTNTFVGDSFTGAIYNVGAGARYSEITREFGVGFGGFDFTGTVGLEDVNDFKAADFNNDGFEDIAVIKQTSDGTHINSLEVWLAKGENGYEISSTLLFGEAKLTADDVNGDGLLDVLSIDNEFLYIAIQGLDGRFSSAIKRPLNTNGCPLTSENDLAIGSNDADGYRDIFLSRKCLSIVEVWQQDAFDQFDTKLEYGYPERFGAGHFGDLNGDALTDIALGSRSNSDGAAIALNTGEGFTISQVLDSTDRFGPQFMFVADTNGNNKPEIIRKVGTEMIIYTRNELDEFTEYSSLTYGIEILDGVVKAALVDDIDSDGDVDIVYISPFSIFTYVKQQAGFELVVKASGHNRVLEVFDYNKDGINDIIRGSRTPYVHTTAVTALTAPN